MTRRSSSTGTSSTLRSSFFRIVFLFEKIILTDPGDIRSCGLDLGNEEGDNDHTNHYGNCVLRYKCNGSF